MKYSHLVNYINANEQLFILTFESVLEILDCEHSNENY